MKRFLWFPVFLSFQIAIIFLFTKLLLLMFGWVLHEPVGTNANRTEWLETGYYLTIASGTLFATIFATRLLPWWNRVVFGAAYPESATEASSIPWPLIRTEKRFMGRRQIVRITAEKISLITTSQSITEDLLTRSEPVRGKHDWKIITTSSIRELHVRRVGWITPGAFWNRFEIHATDQSIHHFKISDRESGTALEAIRTVASGRVRVHAKRSLSHIEILLVLLINFGLSLFLSNPLFHSKILFISPFTIAILVMISTVICLDLKRHSPHRPEKIERKKQRKPPLHKPPLRAPLVGWVLKLLGGCYVLILSCSPIGFLVVSGGQISILLRLLALPGMYLLAIGSRLCLRSFAPGEHTDYRSPILFLRGFTDDGRKTFQPTNRLAKLHGIARYADLVGLSPFGVLPTPTIVVKAFLNAETWSTEELFRFVFRPCGPLVAIGRPGEALSTSGADRMYVTDEEWQNVVMAYLRISQVVILQPSNTEGIRWEVDQVFDRIPKSRILVSLVNFIDRPSDYEGFRSAILLNHGIRLPLFIPFSETPLFAYFETTGRVAIQPVCYRSPLLWGLLGNAVDTRRTFDNFLSGIEGEPRAAPKAPKQFGFQIVLSYYLAYLLPLFISFAGTVLAISLWQLIWKP